MFSVIAKANEPVPATMNRIEFFAHLLVLLIFFFLKLGTFLAENFLVSEFHYHYYFQTDNNFKKIIRI